MLDKKEAAKILRMMAHNVESGVPVDDELAPRFFREIAEELEKQYNDMFNCLHKKEKA